MSKSKLTKKQASLLLQEISDSVSESKNANLHCVLALNDLLRQPNASTILDERLKNHARDLWRELSASGLELEEPPILFGLPEDFNPTEPKSTPAK